ATGRSSLPRTSTGWPWSSRGDESFATDLERRRRPVIPRPGAPAADLAPDAVQDTIQRRVEVVAGRVCVDRGLARDGQEHADAGRAVHELEDHIGGQELRRVALEAHPPVPGSLAEPFGDRAVAGGEFDMHVASCFGGSGRGLRIRGGGGRWRGLAPSFHLYL